MRWLVFFILPLVWSVVACQDQSNTVKIVDEGDFATRQFTPPPGEVRSMPPHDVREEGVGPYKVGMPLQEALSSLEGGPRIELWRAEGLSEYRLVRTENGAMVLGADRAGSTRFISVLDPSIIESPDGVVLGANLDRLMKSLNTKESKRFVSDPALVTLTSLPALRLFVENDKVIAALHLGATPLAENEVKNCIEGTKIKNIEKQIVKQFSNKKDLSLAQGCLEKNPIWVVTLKGQVAIFSVDGGKVKKVVNSYIPGLTRAGVIDIDNDGKDEICFIKAKNNNDEKAIDVAIAKLEGRTLETVISRKVVRLNQSSLKLLGVDLAQSKLLAEVGFKGKELIARAILVDLRNKQIRGVIPLVEARLKIKK